MCPHSMPSKRKAAASHLALPLCMLTLRWRCCRFEDEEGEPVLYVYEIQLDASVQRQARALV